jgi:hypothetical protein
VLNRQPAGGSIGDGTSPSRTIRSLRLSNPIVGAELINAFV